MNMIHCFKYVFLLVILVTLIGCKSKQDKAEMKPGAAPQKTGEIKSISGQNTTGGPTASPQDQADARAAAAQVLARLTAGDFATVYQAAEPGFKKIGSESQFVAKFQQSRQKVGVLKNPKEVSFATLPGKGHVLVYRLENELFNTDMRLSFSRSANGKMELAGLNQHDELKK